MRLVFFETFVLKRGPFAVMPALYLLMAALRVMAAAEVPADPTAAPSQLLPRDQGFEAPSPGEAVAAIVAGCERCDWGEPGREAVAVKLSVDGAYSQHLLLTRGAVPAEYRVMLGPLAAGPHRLSLERDAARSSKSAGEITIRTVDVQMYGPSAPEYGWLNRAPILHARPGTVERFSDVPLLMYVEVLGAPPSEYRYTVIFSHEDGGTPTDRLMATWGRATDIEFVYGIQPAPSGASREEFQGKDHEILPFRGRRAGNHPLLWVSTDNNMVSDTGSDGIRFAPSPALVTLENVSREVVMDANPWLYAVMTAELRREGRIQADAIPGSTRIPDPRTFVYAEGCGDLKDATAAFDLQIRAAGGAAVWYPTDRGDTRFRIARSGCFRVAVPVPAPVEPAEVTAIRVRAYTRPPRKGEAPLAPGTGRAVMRRMNALFVLDAGFTPKRSPLQWTGRVEAIGEGPAVDLPLRPH
ncbi:MAG: hypothetical protein LC753_18920 [Acidobacteria bacterium]|nr:hypothetical protein [Acidobacteriota bacterium]MCA1652237.1 hypothetical protein [Acidobacteriota bacterium]